MGCRLPTITTNKRALRFFIPSKLHGSWPKAVNSQIPNLPDLLAFPWYTTTRRRVGHSARTVAPGTVGYNSFSRAAMGHHPYVRGQTTQVQTPSCHCIIYIIISGRRLLTHSLTQAWTCLGFLLRCHAYSFVPLSLMTTTSPINSIQQNPVVLEQEKNYK